MNVIKWIQKKSKKSERKHKNRNSISSDDQMYPEINNEQTPEYLSAIAQFLERRSSIKISTDAEFEDNISPSNLHNITPNKVKFAEDGSDNRTDNENNIISDDIVERSFSLLSKKNSAEDTGESTFNTTKLFYKNNESRIENKNTSSSVNYEKFQTGKINDSLRKHGTVPSTSFEVSSDSNTQHKQISKTTSRNNLNSSQLTGKFSNRKMMETTDSNTSVISQAKRPNASLKNLTKMSSNTDTNVESSKKQQFNSSLSVKDVMDSNIMRNTTSSKQNSGYQVRSTSLSKENNDRINGFIKHTVRQSAEEASQMEFTSYVPFIPFKDLNWHKNGIKTDFGWYCEWRKPSWNNTLVLIRRIKSSTLRSSNILISEINALSSIRHPNILVLMGYTFDSGDYLMPIYQYFRHSLYCHLHEMACALSLPKIIRIILQIAEALSFTHMMGIIHTTMSSHCIALSDDFNNAKIFGFDFSISTNSGKITENIGRKQWFQWLAPELFDSQSPPEAQVSLDVYSMCVVLWECCYLSIPWKNISYTQLSQVYTKWRMGIPLTNNRYLPTEIYNILKNGFQIDPNQRGISLTEIMRILKEMQKQFQNGENIFLFTSIEQLSSEMNLQKVIIKKYITPENIYQQLSTTTTPSPKSISTNESPQDKGITYEEAEKVDELSSMQRTPKTSKSKLLHKITDFDKSSLKTVPRKIVIPTKNSKNIQNKSNKETQIDEVIVNAFHDASFKISSTETDDSIINAKPSQKIINSTNNLEKVPKFFTKETQIDDGIVDGIRQPSHEIINSTYHNGENKKFANKKTENDESIVDAMPHYSHKILTKHSETGSEFCTKITSINEDVVDETKQTSHNIHTYLENITINIINSQSNGTEKDDGIVEDTLQQVSPSGNPKMIIKNHLQDIKATENVMQSSSEITSNNKNLNKRFDEAVVRNYDIKKLIYEYEILTKHLHDSVVPRVNFDRTKLNTDIKPASHRTTIIEVPVTADSPEYLMQKKKNNLPAFKLSVIQQKRLCIDELKNFFENHLWKKEKNKCLQITDAIPIQKTKSIEIKNVQEHKKVKKSKLKLLKLKENDNNSHFIKDIIIEIIDAVISCSENHNPQIYETNQEIISYNLKKLQINCLKQNIKSLKEYEIQQQKIYSQIKRTFDILNFYINLNNTSSLSPILQTSFTEKLTLNTIDDPLNEYRPMILFKSPNFMNYWQNVLQLYITTQLRDVYIDDDFTSDAVQLTSDLTEFYIFVEDQQD